MYNNNKNNNRKFNQNKNNNKNNKNKKPSYFDQNKDKLNSGQISPKDIQFNTDKIIRDLVQGNISDMDGNYLYNPTIFTSVYNRVLFLYQYNWSIHTALTEFIQTHPINLDPSFIQSENIIRPKMEAYKILLDTLEAFRLSGNYQMIKNIPLSLKMYRNCF